MSYISFLPCNRFNCLKLPICKSKNIIDCELLYDTIYLLTEFDKLIEFFPNLFVVCYKSKLSQPIMVR